MMNVPINELIICALKHSGRPMHSGALLDLLVGIGEEAGWPRAHLDAITRQVIARRLRTLVARGYARVAGEALDEVYQRNVPVYAPAGGYNTLAPIPAIGDADAPDADADDADVYARMSRTQLTAIAQVGDDLAALVYRMLDDMRALQAFPEAARRRLGDAGLEPRS